MENLLGNPLSRLHIQAYPFIRDLRVCTLYMIFAVPTTTFAIPHMCRVYQGCRPWGSRGCHGTPDFVSSVNSISTSNQVGQIMPPHHYIHTGTPGFSNPTPALCTEEEQKFNGYVYGYVKILEEDSTRLVAALSLLSLMSSQIKG